MPSFGTAKRRRPRAAAIGMMALAMALTLNACGSSGSGKSKATGSASPHATSTAQVSPLTGMPGPVGRILAVKIDNIVYARPQTGINDADVVYAIEVEGGLSRFLAVFDSDHLPPGRRIGPVRSARESDLPILQQYGKVNFVYSGALSKFLPLLASADIFNISPNQDAALFSRGTDRPAPYNEYVDPVAAFAAYPDSAQASDIGFRFGAAPAGGRPTTSLTAAMPAAEFTFTWDAGSGRYLVSMDGKAAETTDAGRMGAPTIVIQKVAETTSPHGFMDSPGVLSPFAPTIGSGQAVVLRGGRAYDGTWSRPAAQDGTSFSFQGHPMNFAPGQVWVVLEPK